MHAVVQPYASALCALLCTHVRPGDRARPVGLFEIVLTPHAAKLHPPILVARYQQRTGVGQYEHVCCFVVSIAKLVLVSPERRVILGSMLLGILLSLIARRLCRTSIFMWGYRYYVH